MADEAPPIKEQILEILKNPADYDPGTRIEEMVGDTRSGTMKEFVFSPSEEYSGVYSEYTIFEGNQLAYLEQRVRLKDGELDFSDIPDEGVCPEYRTIEALCA